MTDPITLVHNALWSAVEQHPTLVAEVRAGNRIKFNKRAELATSLQAGDLPELVLFTESSVGALRSSSSSSMLMRRFDWVLTTGDMRVSKYLYPLSWALYESMVAAHALLSALTWNGQPFVNKMNMLSGRDGESNASRRSNVRGWSTLQSVEVNMHFQTSVLVTNAGA